MEKRVGSHKFLVVSAGECVCRVRVLYPNGEGGDVNHIYGNERQTDSTYLTFLP